MVRLRRSQLLTATGELIACFRFWAFLARKKKGETRRTVQFNKIAGASEEACSCGKPQETGFVCAHGIAAIRARSDAAPLAAFMDSRDKLATWHETYTSTNITVRSPPVRTSDDRGRAGTDSTRGRTLLQSPQPPLVHDAAPREASRSPPKKIPIRPRLFHWHWQAQAHLSHMPVLLPTWPQKKQLPTEEEGLPLARRTARRYARRYRLTIFPSFSPLPRPQSRLFWHQTFISVHSLLCTLFPPFFLLL